MTYFIQKHIWWQVHKKYVIVTYMLTYDIDVFPNFLHVCFIQTMNVLWYFILPFI